MDEAGTIPEVAQRLREDFGLLDEYRDKIEYIIDLGKQLTPMPGELKTEVTKVRGCQSQVWVTAEPEGERLRLQADSDAILVKGLIALVLQLYDHRRPQEILDNPPDVLEEIGLQRFLTPGRANGLYAVVGRIRGIAQAAVGSAA